jgi:hypothetical protein
MQVIQAEGIAALGGEASRFGTDAAACPGDE